jgi:hypothetical protein
VAPRKTIYVKDADLPLWGRFEAAAQWSNQDSVSGLISDAMRDHITQFGDVGDGLYVVPPDADQRTGGPTFQLRRTAILERDGADWMLWLDENEFPGEINPYPLFSSAIPVSEAIFASKIHLSEVDLRRMGSLERIEVDCGERVEASTGRWLIAPDPDESRTAEEGIRRGRLLGYRHHQEGTLRGLRGSLQ